MARKSHKGDRASSSAVQRNKFTGVVPQRNGKWGAQIYANNRKKWLGTFESEKKAALAYDRASIKLKGKDSPRNLPNEPFLERELSFQSHFTCEEIVEMIKDHSYDEKLHNKQHQICKVLTVSDLGPLNRLVIPKKYSNHLPIDMLVNGQTTILTVFDSDDKEWKFKFKHCPSSGSYQLTNGWRKFVKDKRLEAGDTVYFTPDSTRGSTFYITISRSTSTEGLNSVPQEGRGPGAVTNMSTMPKDFRDSKPTEMVRTQDHKWLKTEKTDTAKPLSGHELKTEKTDTAKPLSGHELKTEKTDTEGLQGNSIMSSAGLAGHGLKTQKTDTAKPLSGHELKTQKTDTDNPSIKLFGVFMSPDRMPHNP